LVSPVEILGSSHVLGRAILKLIDVGRLAVTQLIGDRRLVRVFGYGCRYSLRRFPVDYRRKDAARINPDALQWISAQNGRPFFAFLNYFDAHAPYYLPQSKSERHFGREPNLASEIEMLSGWRTVANKVRPSVRDIELARDCYDDCIA